MKKEGLDKPAEIYKKIMFWFPIALILWVLFMESMDGANSRIYYGFITFSLIILIFLYNIFMLVYMIAKKIKLLTLPILGIILFLIYIYSYTQYPQFIYFKSNIIIAFPTMLILILYNFYLKWKKVNNV